MHLYVESFTQTWSPQKDDSKDQERTTWVYALLKHRQLWETPPVQKGVIQKYWNKWPLKCSVSSWAWAGLCKIKFLFSSWSTLTQRDRRIQSHPLWFLLAFVGRRLYYLWLDLGSRNSSICGLCGHGMGEKVKGKHCFRGFYLVVPLYEPQQYINII